MEGRGVLQREGDVGEASGQEARAIYDSIFPSADPSGEGQDKTPLGRAFVGDGSTRS